MTTAAVVQPARDLIFCAECNTPVIERKGDDYVIVVRHHGKRHVTVLPAPKKARWLGSRE